jgi:uncharacterized protein (TIGR03118 family)
MSSARIDRTLALASISTALVLALSAPQARAAETYRVRSLVSDGGVPAAHKDKNLVNGWGIAFGPGSAPAWVADNGTGKSTLYDGNGKKLPLVVTIPQGAPTGIVFNGTSGFAVGKGKKRGPAAFIFDSEAGVISGWSLTADMNNAIAAFTAKDGAIYKGLALVTSGQPRLYATDFHNGKVDVLDESFHLAKAPGGFTDPNLPNHFAPFGIREVDGKLIITFAKQDADRHDDLHGPGLGFVDQFDTQGHLLMRLVSHGALNAPWGIALAPADFGPAGGNLLIGNFGDGRIHAYDPVTGAFRGTLKHESEPVKIDGLWGITFGNGVATQPADTLFFAAGPADESHGQYGRIDVVSHH